MVEEEKVPVAEGVRDRETLEEERVRIVSEAVPEVASV